MYDIRFNTDEKIDIFYINPLDLSLLFVKEMRAPKANVKNVLYYC